MSFWDRLRGFVASALPDGEQEGNQYTPLFMLTMWAGCAIGLIALVLAVWQASSVAAGLRIVGWCLMGMLASLATGGFLGMLFGIPRIESAAQVAAAGAVARARIRQNDSLEQIADWLTKTIVGVTLVQSAKAVTALRRLSEDFSGQVFGLGSGSYVPGMAVIVGFSVIGFLLAYVWTRRYWVLEMLATEDQLGASKGTNLGTAWRVIGEATQAQEKVGAEQLSTLVRDDTGRWSSTPSPADDDDPWRGKFGGKAIDAVLGRRLRVEFTKDPEGGDWIQLRAIVESTERSLPLSGVVRFFLHSTFRDPIREVPVRAGRAVVDLRAWGGNFTIAVQTDGGQCQLEQHVASVAPSWVPEKWRKA